MGTWVIENKTKILNLLGLRKSRHKISLWICTQPTISYPYKKQQRNQVETNKQTNSHFQNAEANCETFPIKTSFFAYTLFFL